MYAGGWRLPGANSRAVLGHLGTLGSRAGSGGPELSALLETYSGIADSQGLFPGSHEGPR